MKIILITILVLALAFIAIIPVWGSTLPTISLEPTNQTMAPGQTFEVDVILDLGTDSRGAQFDLAFDCDILTCNSVTEGDLFSIGGTQPTYWNEPIIDNRGNGQILGAACVIINPSMPVSGSGVFATISFTTKTRGTSGLVLSNIVVSDAWGDAVEVIIINGSVTVGLEGDLNLDGRVNVLDMIIVGMNWTG